MNKLHTLLLLSLGATAFAQTADPELIAAAEAVESKVIGWRHDIHEHPELSNREFETAANAGPRAKWFARQWNRFANLVCLD